MTPATGPNIRVRLDGDLTVFTARDVAAILLAHLRNGGNLDVDLSAVGEIDSAGLQVLIAAKRMSVDQGSCLRIFGHSPAVLDLLDLADLVSHFGDPVVIQKGMPA